MSCDRLQSLEPRDAVARAGAAAADAARDGEEVACVGELVRAGLHRPEPARGQRGERARHEELRERLEVDLERAAARGVIRAAGDLNEAAPAVAPAVAAAFGAVPHAAAVDAFGDALVVVGERGGLGSGEA